MSGAGLPALTVLTLPRPLRPTLTRAGVGSSVLGNDVRGLAWPLPGVRLLASASGYGSERRPDPRRVHAHMRLTGARHPVRAAGGFAEAAHHARVMALLLSAQSRSEPCASLRHRRGFEGMSSGLRAVLIGGLVIAACDGDRGGEKG